MNYYPDGWVVVKITNKETSKHHYRVFTCWYGGFAKGDSWRLNSGITKVTKEGKVYGFEGSSGSVYYCHEDNYRLNMYGRGVLDKMIQDAIEVTIEEMKEESDWLNLNYD